MAVDSTCERPGNVPVGVDSNVPGSDSNAPNLADGTFPRLVRLVRRPGPSQGPGRWRSGMACVAAEPFPGCEIGRASGADQLAPAGWTGRWASSPPGSHGGQDSPG